MEFHTDKQWKAVLQNDFVAWLDLLYKEDNVPQGAQYEYFDEDNVDRVIDILSENVTVLVNECFEASLHLLEHQFRFPPHAATAFLQSKRARSNISAQRNTTGEDLEELRAKSKGYFVEEYKFYHAAVEQFKQSLDPTLALTCDL